MDIKDSELKRSLSSTYGMGAVDYCDTDNISVKNIFNINDVVYYYDDARNVIVSKRIVSIQLQPDSRIIYNYAYETSRLFKTYDDALNYAIKHLKDNLNDKIEQLKKGKE